MVEYSVLLGNNIRELWSDQILPLIDTIRSSPFFWPVIVTAVLAFLLLTRRSVK